MQSRNQNMKATQASMILGSFPLWQTCPNYVSPNTVGLILLSCQQKVEFYQSQLFFPSLHIVKLSWAPNTTDSIGVVLFHCYQNITLINHMIFLISLRNDHLRQVSEGRKFPFQTDLANYPPQIFAGFQTSSFFLPQYSPLVFRAQLWKE